jgi:hypothetical protein
MSITFLTLNSSSFDEQMAGGYLDFKSIELLAQK